MSSVQSKIKDLERVAGWRFINAKALPSHVADLNLKLYGALRQNETFREVFYLAIQSIKKGIVDMEIDGENPLLYITIYNEPNSPFVLYPITQYSVELTSVRDRLKQRLKDSE